MHGAIQESQHVFINQGFRKLKKKQLRLLEIGFGTGLNLLLTLQECILNGISVHYHTVEKYPLIPSEYDSLNYESLIDNLPGGILNQIHMLPWGEKVNLLNYFTLFKEKSDFRSMNPEGPFDLVYFDAFAPDKQPELWSSEVFSTISKLTNSGAILVTYSSRGSVRRALSALGFQVFKVPGPPGKREMIRAIKI
jgi:tRNA U34 5-methylaminomethyl-2-thiouridine-forming methyltransferase MnmC